MSDQVVRIAVVAPSSRLSPEVPARVNELAAGLYPDRCPQIVFHPQCLASSGHFAGDDAVRAAAFVLTILASLIGTPWQPDLTGHVLMLEEVSEAMYRIDRTLFHVTSNPAIRRVAGIRLGRCSDIPENDPDFAMTEEEVARY